MSNLGDAADVNSVSKFVPHTLHVCGRNSITGLTSAASPRVDISSTSNVGQKIGVSLPLLTCSPSAWPSRLLYRRGRKSRRDLLITLYFLNATQCVYINSEGIEGIYLAAHLSADYCCLCYRELRLRQYLFRISPRRVWIRLKISMLVKFIVSTSEMSFCTFKLSSYSCTLDWWQVERHDVIAGFIVKHEVSCLSLQRALCTNPVPCLFSYYLFRIQSCCWQSQLTDHLTNRSVINRDKEHRKNKFEVFKMPNMKVRVLWCVTSCILTFPRSVLPSSLE
jgi:hypothetical protein